MLRTLRVKAHRKLENRKLKIALRKSESEMPDPKLSSHLPAVFGFPFASLGTRISALLARLAAILAVLASPVAARAQGCAMCYTSAASARAVAIQALRSGVLILLVPPLVMMGVILIVVYRYRNRFNPAPAGLPWTPEDERELKEWLQGVERQDAERSFQSSVVSPQ
jgi:hypothetical protein